MKNVGLEFEHKRPAKSGAHFKKMNVRVFQARDIEPLSSQRAGAATKPERESLSQRRKARKEKLAGKPNPTGLLRARSPRGTPRSNPYLILFCRQVLLSDPCAFARNVLGMIWLRLGCVPPRLIGHSVIDSKSPCASTRWFDLQKERRPNSSPGPYARARSRVFSRRLRLSSSNKRQRLSAYLEGLQSV